MISLIIIFSYGYILHTKSGGIFQVKETYEYIFNIGTMRALGGIGLGYIIGRIYKEKFLTSSYNSIKLALCSTISEFILLYFIINNLILHKPNFNNHILFVIAFGAIIILFILKKGVISKLLEKYENVKVTRLAHGLPMGAQLDYADEMTLFKAFSNRKEVNK